ncbi:MAG TPA: DNA replication/repair protein RecF [Caulobacteraceae bacterium]
MTASALASITLTDVRSYPHAALALAPGPVVLFGPNGAGKTNLVEAVSLLTPGRGLRGAAVAEIGRREPGETAGRPWAVSAEVLGADGEPVRVGTGVQGAGAARRVVRIEGETVAPGRLLEHLRLIWLTPQQDRLFAEARAERLKFFDRLVFADAPSHAGAVSAYEKALRERLRLLTDGPADPMWLDALEARLGEAGAAMVLARAVTLERLQAAIDARADRPFPRGVLALAGAPEAGREEAGIAADIALGMARARQRDAAAGRSLYGPHRTDFAVVHREKNRPAAEGSTGEQKALVLNLVLAQASRLSTPGTGEEKLANSAPNPILLLDEAAAHLDANRRAALFEEISALGLQAFLTGTDETLFSDLKGRRQAIRVDAGTLTVMDD